MTTTQAQVRQYIEDNFLMGAGAAAPDDDASFLEHHVLDSTGFLELVAYLEQTFAITIGDDEMLPENLDSLNAIAAFVERKRATA